MDRYAWESVAVGTGTPLPHLCICLVTWGQVEPNAGLCFVIAVTIAVSKFINAITIADANSINACPLFTIAVSIK